MGVVPQNVSRIHIGLENSSGYEAAPGWQLDARTVLWQYGRFDEDAVPWRRLERVEDKRLPVERIDEQSA
jgi:hypothetical protein